MQTDPPGGSNGVRAHRTIRISRHTCAQVLSRPSSSSTRTPSRTCSRVKVAVAAIRAAPSRWNSTSTIGRSVKYCTKPISPWASSTTTSRKAARTTAAGAPDARRATSRPSESPTKRNTASAWACEICSGSSPLRGASASPACGPEPVTTVPRASTTQAAAYVAQASTVSRGGREPRGHWVVDPPHVEHREADDPHREQQVERDHPRVQVGEHRDPAEHRLRRDAEPEPAARVDAGRRAGTATHSRRSPPRSRSAGRSACGCRTRSPSARRARRAA